MNLTLEFGRTNSPWLPQAIRRAKMLPGFTQRQSDSGPEISVSTAVPFDQPELWARIEGLLRLVGSWKSTTLTIDGKKIQPCWQAIWNLSEVVSCYAARQTAGGDPDYCLGKDTPSSAQTTFGCRLLKGLDLRDYGANTARWHEFGHLSHDQKRFIVDKAAIEVRLRSANKARCCVSCPVFSWLRASEAISRLPAEINLAKADRLSNAPSRRDLVRPAAIQRKEHSPELGIRLGVRELPSQTPKRQVPKVFYKDIAGQDEALQQLRDVCELPLKYPEYFSALGLTPHRGAILFGPPGNGKTLLAKAVATESNAHLEIINGPEILSKLVGQSEANLRGAFERARTLAPSIIVIDELDAIAPARAEMTHQHSITLISQLLVCLDGMNERGAVFVIGTTNRLEAVDSALKRPGRFDYHIEVPLPNANGRKAILQIHVAKLARMQEVDVSDIVASTPNWSGADLRAVVTEAGLLAVKRSIRLGMEPRATMLTQCEIRAAVTALLAKREARRQ